MLYFLCPADNRPFGEIDPLVICFSTLPCYIVDFACVVSIGNHQHICNLASYGIIPYRIVLIAWIETDAD